MKAFVFSF